jgi:hypothetical protein
MVQLLGGVIPCANHIADVDQVNEMAVQCYRRNASVVLCVQWKRKRNDFSEARTARLKRICGRPSRSDCPLHGYYSAVTMFAPRKIPARTRVPGISVLLYAVNAERFSFNARDIGQMEFSHDLTGQFRISRAFG